MDYQAWVGQTETVTDHVTPRQAALMAALLDRRAAPQDGDPLPPLWHWMAFQPIAPMSALGPDGHPARGGFLPPVPLERRMWAGGRVTFHGTALVGIPMVRRSEIMKVAKKTGGSGPIVLVTIRHDISQNDALCLIEEQDLAYVSIPDAYVPPAALPAPENPVWRMDLNINEVMLFRFSAATLNGHRIHYDLHYATEIEHYPGLVVHGPLQALALADAAQRQRGGAPACRFSFRGVRPAFHFEPLQILGLAEQDGVQRLCTATPGNLQCMQAEVAW